MSLAASPAAKISAGKPALRHPALPWILLWLLCLGAVFLKGALPWLGAFPAGWQLPIPAFVANITSPVFAALQPFGRIAAAGISVPLGWIQYGLQSLPWPAAMLIVAALCLRASGWKLAAFSIVALGYVVLVGYWRQGMNTLAIVLISVPAAMLAGFLLGALAHRFSRLGPAVEVLLDLMQTVPAFAYLIPLLLVFGFGPAAGMVASVIFALPPMVRNTMLGLRLVPPEIRESALMSGATGRQLFWLAEVPAALPRLMVGLNQTTMAALSMVIIVAIIGGFDDIGWEVLAAMRGAEMGRSLLSGLVIVVIAILLDRITLGLATPSRARGLSGRGLALVIAGALALGFVLAAAFPGQTFLPASTGHAIGRSLDQALLAFVAWGNEGFTAFRNAITYGAMLPLRLGLAGSATPVVWGITPAPWMTALYAALSLGLAAVLWRRGWKGALAVLFAALALYTGLPGFPWAGFIAVVVLLGHAAGGPRLAFFAGSSLAIILLSGLWLPFMQSVYLCAIAVAFCLLAGGALGVLAAENDWVSAVLRPINDALQTMPQFVFLIPALMLFRVGEFTALIAIMLYAIVPPIRYLEQGLRSVPPDKIEAARQMGANRWQMLWWVRMPMARPAIRLGLNQTIMAALSMLVIAAMVGTRDLGQQVYVALGKADPGLGFVAGLSIAAIAMTADRMLRRRP